MVGGESEALLRGLVSATAIGKLAWRERCWGRRKDSVVTR